MVYGISNYQSSGINSIYSTQAINRNTYLYKNSKSIFSQKNIFNLYDNGNAQFISDYTSKIAGLKELNSKLANSNKNNVMETLTATSSDDKVASAKSFFTIKEKATYELNVKKTAKAQVNASNALDSNAISDMGISSLSISSKGKNYSFTIDTAGMSNKETLQEIASRINKSNIGVSAVVKEKDNKSSIELVGDKTGEGEDFTVSGTEKMMLNTNLSNVTQIAENAVYDVTKDGNVLAKDKSSSTNEIDIDGYKVSATLKDVGKTTISLAADRGKIAESVKNFVSAFNSTIDFLDRNVDKGSAISRQLENLKIPDINKKSLETLGISIKDDGKLSLDEKALDKSLKENLSGVESVLSNRYSAFNRLDNKINSALKESSINLIDSSIYNQNESSNNSLLDRLNMFSMYGGRSAFGMVNQSAVGMMLNMFA